MEHKGVVGATGSGAIIPFSGRGTAGISVPGVGGLISTLGQGTLSVPITAISVLGNLNVNEVLDIIAFRVPRSGTFRNLRVSVGTTAGIILGNVHVSLFVANSALSGLPNYVETNLSVTISSFPIIGLLTFNKSQNTSDTVAVNAGDFIMLGVYWTGLVIAVDGVFHAGIEFV